MHRCGLAALALLATTVAAPAQDKLIMDKSHFLVGFETEHFGYSRVAGRFNEASGELVLDAKNPAASKLKVTVNTSSVDTNFKARDDHLRSADFFDVQKFPTMTFESTAVEVTGDKLGKVTGNLTIKGVTKPIVLEVRARDSKAYPLPAYKGLVASGFEATGKVNREEFAVGKGDAVLTLRADFIKCEGEAAESPSCKVSK
jgi:polyisoprenoid-binding protein YceI